MGIKVVNQWLKGKKVDRKKYPSMGHFKKHSEETKEKLRLIHLGRKQTKEHIENRRKALKGRKGVWLGKKQSPTHRLNNSLGHKGEKSYRWKGGISHLSKPIRKSLQFRLWRESVFQRDNYTCQCCGIHSGLGKAVILHPHHIKSFSEYPELRFEISNGQTLCEDCHKNTDNFGGKIKCKASKL